MSNKIEQGHPLDILGTEVLMKSTLLEDAQAYCVMSTVIPAGVTVPLHSHDDRETLYVTSGILEAFIDDQWQTLGAGDVIDVFGGMKHALRNTSAHRVSAVLVTTTRMAQFFASAARPAPAGPLKPEDFARFVVVADEFGAWLASAQENAAVGISTAFTPPAEYNWPKRMH